MGESKPAHAKPAYAAPKIVLDFNVCATRLRDSGEKKHHDLPAQTGSGVTPLAYGHSA
jgi:hypothetical protein